MKLIFLNTWNGRVTDEISKFITEVKLLDTAVFCFQEVYEEMSLICEALLPEYSKITAGKQCNEDYLRQMTCVRKEIEVSKTAEVGINNFSTGFGLYTKLTIGSAIVHVCNFHGTPRPGGKLDTPDRITQSQTIANFFSNLEGPKIIGGDFNLELNTKSVNLLEEAGFRNLIRDYKVQTTRNHHVWDKYPSSKQLYSDYVFVSADTVVKNFFVPTVVVSDHQPLILEIEV